MRSKVVVLYVAGLLLLFGLNGLANSQPPDLTTKVDYDTCDIAITYHTAYPGTETWIEVLMRNPYDWVSGYTLFLVIGSPEIARFSQDSTGACFIQGSPFPWVSCECQDENCMWVRTEGSALGDTLQMIPPSPNYIPLFKIRADVCCIPDSSTYRESMILISANSYLYDRYGNSLPLRRHDGVLFIWWSVPGDASGDSLVDMADIIFLINYLYQGGPEPCVCEAADCNNDGVIDIGDIMYLINYLYKNGPAPIWGSARCWHLDCRPQ